MENVLMIGAHPDDIELGCIGTLLKLKKAGKKIIYLVMTNGGNWEKKTYKDRMEEISVSIRDLNLDKVTIGNFKDGYLFHNPEVIDYLANIIKENSIDTIFCQYFKDSHQDHVNIGLNALSVASLCKNLLFYESLTSTEFVANYYVDITYYEKEKRYMLNSYSSQVDKYKNRNQNLLEYIEAKDKLNGIKIHADYAEGFIVYKMTA